MGMTYAQRKAQSGKRKRTDTLGLLGMAWGAKRTRGSRAKFPSTPSAATRARGKRARASTTRRSVGSQTRAVSSMPRNRIGKDNGLIVSNQRVPHPKKGSIQYRKSNYGLVEATNKLWIGGSSIGREVTHFRCIAHAILAHYLPKLGDMRSSNDQAPSSTTVLPATPVFGSFQVQYGKDAPSNAMTGAQFFDGPVIVNASYTAMAVALGLQMADQAHGGLYPMAITFAAPVGGIGTNNALYRDVNMGRHVITVSVQGRFRFQNVTAAGEGDASTNINAVDANPCDGKVYTFRNQAPLFSSNYVSAFDLAVPADALTVEGIEVLQNVRLPFEMYGDSNKGAAAFDHIKAPPLNPKSIWRNVSSTGSAVFPPGGFKTFTTSYLRSESIFKYCSSITQDDKLSIGTYDTSSVYPPAGDSFMMCLRPTIKTANEVIKMAYNTEYILKASIQRRKVSALQVVNDIE